VTKWFHKCIQPRPMERGSKYLSSDSSHTS